MKRSIIIGLFLSFFCLPVNSAQAQPTDNLFEEDIDLEDFLSDIPGLDLNRAGEKELRMLPGFGPQEITLFIAFRDSLPKGSSVAPRLNEIPGLNSFHRAVLKASASKPGVQSLLKASFRSGFTLPAVQGNSSAGYYSSLTVHEGDQYRLGFIGERDPFEPRAVDYLSGHVALSSPTWGGSVLLGDFRPGFGQGLVWSRQTRNYLSGTAVIRRDSVRPENTSREESLFLRGAMIGIERERYDLRLWSSFRMLDARTGKAGNPVGVRTTGIHYHGMDRGNLSEKILGAHFTLKTNSASVSISGSTSAYSPSLERESGELNMYDPASGSFRYVSVAGVLDYRAASFFFESALMNESEHAAIAGVSFRRNGAKASAIIRRYSPEYWALRAVAPSISGNPSNEEGIYSAMEMKLPFRIQMEASVDLARTLGRTYTADMPASRKKMLVAFERKLYQHIYGRLLYRSGRDSGKSSRRESLVWKMERDSGRDSSFHWSSLTAWSRERREGGPYGEAALSYGRRGRRIEMGVGAFHIPSYQARFYRYEANVPGRGYTAAVWGKGISAVTVCSWGVISVRYRAIHSDLMGRIQEITVQGDCGF
ncbi:MAG: hypothetical protein ACYC9O_16225 [Candidatus Latescibacterota bacterium]